jgi:proteasome lid subunit RPN8/RPN11
VAGDGRIIVGWYHSHPKLGAFFSGTDRATQRAFFNHPYSVGLVVDPWRNEDAWFLGPEAASLTRQSVLDVDLRAASSTCSGSLSP